MSNDSATAYLRTKVLTASPEELRLMLLDGAIKFARQGQEGLDKKDHEAVYTGFTKCRNIILELMNSVRADAAPDLKQKINGVYTFMYLHLTEASFEKDAVKAARVIDLLEYERETWVLAMQKVAEERGAGVPAPVAAAEPRVSQSRPALSLQA